MMIPVIPHTIGKTNTYSSYGRIFTVKRLNHSTWHLRAHDITSRSRFGSLPEITQDVINTLEAGILPGGNKGRW